ncbi:MAG: glycosyltransferase [Allobaculum sp.]|nr:glycosyltransferase [Allobaculum sp.]
MSYYRFDADRIEIFTHPEDNSSYILIWGAAMDSESEDDVFEMAINDYRIPVRVRRLENPSLDPRPGARPGYVLRAEIPSILEIGPKQLETLDLAYNHKEVKRFEKPFLMASINSRGLVCPVDMVDVRKNKLLLGGWVVCLEEVQLEVLDAHGQVLDANLTLSNRFDVRRFYFVQNEHLFGYHASIKNADQIAMPVSLRITAPKTGHEWIIPTAPEKPPIEEVKEVVLEESETDLNPPAQEKSLQESTLVKQEAPTEISLETPEPFLETPLSNQEPTLDSQPIPAPEANPLPTPPAPHRTPLSLARGVKRRVSAVIDEQKERFEAHNERIDKERMIREGIPLKPEPNPLYPGPTPPARQDLILPTLEETSLKDQEVVASVEEIEEDFNDQYNRWFLENCTKEDVLAKQRRFHFKKHPKVSLIVAAYNTPIDLLEKMIDSVRQQTYDNWQLCIADGSTTNEVSDYLKANPDPKISWTKLSKNLGISGNMNAAADLATGEIIALYDHDDFLEPDTLYEVIKAFNEKDYDVVYTDEDKYEDSTGRYVGPNFKPDFSPALLQSTNYICHFLAIKREAYERAGGKLYPEFDGAQDFDLVLRLMDSTTPDKIKHIPKILYHWRMHDGSTALDADNKTWAYDAGERALEAWIARNQNHGKIMKTEIPGHYHVRFEAPEKPLVSIIIPNKDHIDDLEFCLQSLENHSSYTNYEVIVVENNSEKKTTFYKYKELRRRYPNMRVVMWRKPFNYSAINNFGVRRAKGDYLLFLNNDTEALDPYLIEEMLGQAMQPNVGAVGAKLYYEDGTFQHNGVIIGHSGVAGHALSGQSDINLNYRVRTVHNVSAVTGACMMVPKKVFKEVGGFNENLPVAYNDVDLCLRIRQHGYWIVQNPFAMMYHYESRSRGYENTPEKQARFENDVRKMYALWPDVLRMSDPFYNPNLDITNVTYKLRKPEEINRYINPVFLGESYYTAGTIRPSKPTQAQLDYLEKMMKS